jgi:hypothetical protein
MINGTNVVVTSIYELRYEPLRGDAVYKSFSLLTETIRSLIFDEYQYVIYTDKFTYEKHNFSNIFNKSNIDIRIKELNSELYLNEINPIREKKFNEGEIYDRIYCVKNYIEVILNKLGNILEVSNEINNGSVVWLDSGLFGTSCHNGWRDYLRDEVVYKKEFLDRIFEKINQHGFIATKGNQILINYELKHRLNEFAQADIKIIPGCLFGGKRENNIEILSDYLKVYLDFIHKYKHLISEQELLSFLTVNKNVKFFEFGDWLDLQKSILEIMDLYDESKYIIDSCIHYKTNSIIGDSKSLISNDLSLLEFNSFTELSDILGMDRGSLHENHMYTEIYEKYLNKFIDSELTMIEIGFTDPRFPGKSLIFWDKLFPNLKYYGIDNIQILNFDYNQEKMTLINCDQNNKEDLKYFIQSFDLDNKIDLIIDDGTHQSEHILTSFTTLFPHIKKGGFYFIEDLHASWALRDETIKKIGEFLNESYPNQFEITYFGIKLMLITKL